MFKKSIVIVSLSIFMSFPTSLAHARVVCTEPGAIWLRSSKLYSYRLKTSSVTVSLSLPSGCTVWIARAYNQWRSPKALFANCPNNVVTPQILDLPGYWMPDGSSFVDSFCYPNGDCFDTDLYYFQGCLSCCEVVDGDDDGDDDDDDCPDLNLTIRGTLLPARRGTARVSGDWCKSLGCGTGIFK